MAGLGSQVRRELARNFAFYNGAHYDSFAGVPAWARVSLLAHAHDPRPACYNFSQLERGETADACWNAAQWEMVATGHMHNYLRMYWCKQIVLWCAAGPELAFRWALSLNDRYELDGRDENASMGVAWCFGHHDRPFPERAVFGSVRSMSATGLCAKFDLQRYCSGVRAKCIAAAQAQPRLRALLPDAAFAYAPPAAFRGAGAGAGGKKRKQGEEDRSDDRDIRSFFGKSAR